MKNKLYVIKNSKIHGKGVYARIDIKKRTKIIEYVGEKLTKKQGDVRAQEQYNLSKKNKNMGSVYVFELDNKYDIDGYVSWNPARLINHSCDSNCKYKMINKGIWIVARKDIKKGEEITYDYGYDLEDYKDHPCKCGSKNCIGYIVGKHYKKKLIRILKKKKNN